MAITIIIFILVLSLLVFVHEIGHFWTARKFGAKVEEFGFGLPPRVFGVWRANGKWYRLWGGNKNNPDGKYDIEPVEQTIYSLNWIPVGGFVKIKGEDGENRTEVDSFGYKKIWQRLIILAAGVVMNVLLCVVFLTIGFMVGMPAVIDGVDQGQIISEPQVRIMEVLDGLPAQASDLRVGDVILTVAGNKITGSVELQALIKNRVGEKLAVTVDRNGAELTTEVAVIDYHETAGFGIGVIETGLVRYPWYLAVWRGIKTTYIWFITIIVAFAMIIKNLAFNTPIGLEVAGPVGIAVLTGQAAKMGWVYVLQFTALLSLNLAIINALPFPALDGGRMAFLLIEKIRGRAIKQKWENLVHNIGFILLMILVVFITYRDVIKYGGALLGKIKGVVGM